MEDYYQREKERKPSKIAIGIIGIMLLLVGYYAVTLTMPRIYQPPKETLTVGVNTPFPPFEFRAGDKVVGFDIDLAHKIAEKLDRKVVIKDFSDFAAIWPAIETGDIDMAISAITITPERDEVVDFSIPYYTASQAVLTTKNSKFKPFGNLSLENFEGIKVGYQEKTTSQFWAEENLIGKINLAGTASFGDMALGLQLLRLGAVDVIILDKPVADTFVKEYQDLAMAGTIETNESYGVVVQEGDPQHILPAVSEVIKEMEKSGDYNKLIQKWFGGEKK